MNTFKFIGQIKAIKDDGKERKSIETVEFPNSGWMIQRVKFRMSCGDSTEFVDLSGGKFKDESKNTVYTLFRKGSSSDREVTKAQVAWADRFNADVVEKVPSYKKYTVDLSSDNIRKELDEKGEHEAVAELAKLKYSYIAQYDFVQKVAELLQAGAFGDGTFVVSGNIEYNFSMKNNDEGVYYRSFVPTNIYRAKESDVQAATGKLELYYLPDDVIGVESESGETSISGYLQFYERMSQENFYTPTTIQLKSELAAMQNVINKDGSGTESEVKMLGFNVQFFNGSPKEAITYEDLTQDEKDLIAWKIQTFEEVVANRGGYARGENVSKVYITGLARGWTAPQYAEVDAERLMAKPSGEKKSKAKTETKAKKFDLFDDDDDI